MTEIDIINGLLMEAIFNALQDEYFQKYINNAGEKISTAMEEIKIDREFSHSNVYILSKIQIEFVTKTYKINIDNFLEKIRNTIIMEIKKIPELKPRILQKFEFIIQNFEKYTKFDKNILSYKKFMKIKLQIGIHLYPFKF